MHGEIDQKSVEDVGIMKHAITKSSSLREDMEEIKKSAAASNRDEVDQLKKKNIPNE